jgi:hypothetical protein
MKPFLFALKIWLTSALAGPLLVYFADNPDVEASMTFLGYMAVTCSYGLLFSSPCFLVLWATTAWLKKSRFPTTKNRWIITVIGLLLTAALFVIFSAGNHPDWTMLSKIMGCYAAAGTTATWLFKFPARPIQSTSPQ